MKYLFLLMFLVGCESKPKTFNDLENRAVTFCKETGIQEYSIEYLACFISYVGNYCCENTTSFVECKEITSMADCQELKNVLNKLKEGK